MDFNKTVDLIIRDLEEARDIIDDLKSFPGVPLIQVELAKAKCRNAAEVIALLKSRNNYAEADTVHNPAVTQPAEKVPENVKTAEAGKTEEGRRKSDEEIRRKKAETGKKKGQHGGSGIIADTFDHLPDSLNESLGSKLKDDDIPEYLKAKPLVSLAGAIGINDRFLFIRELFDGDTDSFSKAISSLDQANNLSDARTIMINLTGDKIQTEAGKQLLDLIKRRFPCDE